MTIADLERMSNKFTINPISDCWEWQKSLNPDGYGTFWLDGRGRTAHRVLYQAIYGQIKEKLVLDHEVCDNRACINPHHLVPKSDWDNRRRSAWYGNDELCKRGHRRIKSNLYIRKDGKKECRLCRKLEMIRFYEKHKAASSRGGKAKRNAGI